MDAPGRARREARIATIVGLASLASAMGIGRFAFTPLFPLMQDSAGITLAQASWIASANYLGYLVGAVASYVAAVKAPLAARWGLVVVAASTLLTAFADTVARWVVLRLVAGAASAFVLIGASAWALALLARSQRLRWSGWVFAGVGVGICLRGERRENNAFCEEVRYGIRHFSPRADPDQRTAGQGCPGAVGHAARDGGRRHHGIAAGADRHPYRLRHGRAQHRLHVQPGRTEADRRSDSQPGAAGVWRNACADGGRRKARQALPAARNPGSGGHCDLRHRHGAVGRSGASSRRVADALARRSRAAAEGLRRRRLRGRRRRGEDRRGLGPPGVRGSQGQDRLPERSRGSRGGPCDPVRDRALDVDHGRLQPVPDAGRGGGSCSLSG